MRRINFALVLFAVATFVRGADDDLLTVKGEPKQENYLIGADAAPKDKPCGLLLVLPGGDGSKEFHGFVTSIQQDLPKGFLVAQLVALSSDDQQVIWPLEKVKHKKQTFSTQQFIENVVKEVKAKQNVDNQRILALGWSSSGNAIYAPVLTPNSLVKGAIVAMSVFHPQSLPPFAGAKGKRVVIMHSPEDKIPIRFAETAQKQLKDSGAQVQFVRMKGGHGWHDDPLGSITKAVKWLEQPAGK